MLKLRRCADGKWVFDRGDYVEFINSNRQAKVYTNQKGRFIRSSVNHRVNYLEYFKEVEQ